MKFFIFILLFLQVTFAKEFVVVYTTVCKLDEGSFELSEGKFPIQFNSNNNNGDISLINLHDSNSNITFHPITTKNIVKNSNGVDIQYNNYILDTGEIVEILFWNSGTIIIVSETTKFIYTKCNKDNFNNCIDTYCN
jgi:hypothetical protein